MDNATDSTNNAVNGNDTTHHPNSTAQEIAALEVRYMRLLQEKIASLEGSLVGAGEVRPPTPPPIPPPAINGTAQVGAFTVAEKGAQDGNKVAESRKDVVVNGSNSQSDNNSAETPNASGQPDDERRASSTGAGKAQDQRVKYRESKLNSSNIREEQDATADVQDSTKEDPSEKAVEVVRVYVEKNKYDHTILKLLDPNLRSLVLFVVAHDPWVRSRTHKHEIWLYSPFEPIIHAWSQFSDIASRDPQKALNEELHKKIQEYAEDPRPRQSDVLQGLAALKDEQAFQRAVDDLNLLLDVVKVTPDLQYFFKDGREITKTKKAVTWELLWTIFPPGELVVSNESFMKNKQVFLVESAMAVDTFEDMADKKYKWILDCWAYDWNGSTFKRVWAHFLIEKYKNEKQIEQLPVYPVSYLSEEQAEKLKADLVARGKKFRDFTHPKSTSVFQYRGFALSRGEGFRKMASDSKQKGVPDTLSLTGTSDEGIAVSARRIMIDDDVIIDFKAFLTHGPSFDGPAPIGDKLKLVEPFSESLCRCDLCEENLRLRDNQKSDFDNESDPSKLGELQLMMLPPRVLGYWLSRKRWVELNVENVISNQRRIDETSFNQLQLSPAKKGLIKSLVRNHGSGEGPQRQMTDLNPEKGNGLIILLHGPPGVGKTSTAESIARATGKPLLPVNASDVGLDSSLVERRFDVLFELAKTWQAVMLFDEADVFLESRSNSIGDLDRNALVSVLLRSLEYFSGILILTTNRIRQLDVAVQSRINLAIRFPNLKEDQKRRIYEGFVNKLEDDAADKPELLNWIKSEDDNETEPFKKLNGRQIRNVLFSAATYASEPNGTGKLKLEHVKRLLRETCEFQDDVKIMLQDSQRKNEVAYDINNS